MELKVIKVKPGRKPIDTVINIKDDIIYVKDKKGSELHLVNINNKRLKMLELEKKIVIIYIEPIFDYDNIAYDIEGYPMEKNQVINEVSIYGDFIIVGYINGKYTSLKEQNIEKYINKLSI